MDTSLIGGIRVSRVGIGGHYRAMEEGEYEQRYAYVEREIDARIPLIRAAVEGGVTFFDTTWRNEVSVLAAVIEALGVRERVAVNGMVLGAFTGSKAFGVSMEDYLSKWLDERLEVLPGGRFETFMINAIEEGFDPALCERAVRWAEARKKAGCFRVFGLSTHDPFHARRVLDEFPAFELAMVPYNFRNRRFEEAFATYNGAAAFIAMKPLVWTEYGVPFCAINRLADFEGRFGFQPDPQVAVRALRFLRANPRVKAVFNAVNSPAEVADLLAAGEGEFTPEDARILDSYHQAITAEGGKHLFLAGLKMDHLRVNYFAAMHLARLLGVAFPSFKLNEPGAQEQILAFGKTLEEKAG